MLHPSRKIGERGKWENVREIENIIMTNNIEKWEGGFRSKWEGANTGGHNAISTPVMDEIISDINQFLSSQAEEWDKNLEESPFMKAHDAMMKDEWWETIDKEKIRQVIEKKLWEVYQSDHSMNMEEESGKLTDDVLEIIKRK